MEPENEEKLNAALDEIIKNKTVLVIAHRLSTVKNADKICVIKDGQCIAEGTHNDLVMSSPEYRKFWEASVSASVWKIKGA
jgi:ATP-binding cassette subfamily B protein